MDLSYGKENEEFRVHVRAFLKEHWPAASADKDKIVQFRMAAVEAGYMYRNIPKVFGGAEQPVDVLKAQVIREEFESFRAPQGIRGVGVEMLVPTLLECGSKEQKEKFISATISGKYKWCQGYSEPGSGSDLASLRTKAVLDGDNWVINGQKIWTSHARQADYMFALVRTEPNEKKHAGISYLLIDLKQPGITIRPLKQITGDSQFNEVFFDDATTPADWIVGERGQGWDVSRTTLKHERNMIGGSAKLRATFEKLVSLAKETSRGTRPAIEDPEVRQWLVKLEGYVMAHEYSGYQQLTKNLKGESPGIIGLMNKLSTTNIGHETARIAMDLIGEDGLCMPPKRVPGKRVGNAKWVNQYFGSLGVAIAGGTSNIQRNIIAERGLGLPRDKG
ncbi:MAG: acyl-CoA dehydrogenase family protein [Kordiimonadaceae bacterium]|nr:acyl-CoA dehydrogenase family protein [Kordiimonadaceae bacterium]